MEVKLEPLIATSIATMPFPVRCRTPPCYPQHTAAKIQKWDRFGAESSLSLLGLCATHFSSFAIVRTEHPIQSAMNVELGPSDRSLPSKAMDADLPIEVRI